MGEGAIIYATSFFRGPLLRFLSLSPSKFTADGVKRDLLLLFLPSRRHTYLRAAYLIYYIGPLQTLKILPLPSVLFSKGGRKRKDDSAEIKVFSLPFRPLLSRSIRPLLSS